MTLVGPGGAGKTRLAGEALARWVDRVADGVWLVELAPGHRRRSRSCPRCSARSACASGRARARRGVPRDGLERLLDALADRETILLLDNCEHLIAGAAELADRLLGRLPGAADRRHQPRAAGDRRREPRRRSRRSRDEPRM